MFSGSLKAHGGLKIIEKIEFGLFIALCIQFYSQIIELEKLVRQPERKFDDEFIFFNDCAGVIGRFGNGGCL